MLAGELPSRHTWEQRARQCDAAVAGIGSVKVYKPFVAILVAIRGKAGLAYNEQKLVVELAQGLLDLCVQAFAQCHRTVEYALRRNTPGIGIKLDFAAVPPAVFAQARQVLVRQCLPGVMLGKAQILVKQP